jgi:hypothetical protein
VKVGHRPFCEEDLIGYAGIRPTRGAFLVTQEELCRAIRRRSAHGKVACKALLELAGKAAVPPRKIGALCDQMKIKIVGCQLGCFQ